jgi:23S rRNA pseudouridine1911/1915/1917 synthase
VIADTPEVIFIDEHLLILHKPSGMPSESTKLSAFGTATAWVEAFLKQQSKNARPTSFIAAAHRLDTPTSGLLCIGLSKAFAGKLQTQFTEHTAKRTYIAIVEGCISWEEKRLVHQIEVDKSRSKSSVVKAPRGREARSAARVLQRTERKTCVMLQPETGLTHQLRVQLQAEGHPIVGDSRYGSSGAGRIALHAYALSMRHPKSAQPLYAEAPPPESFWALWR